MPRNLGLFYKYQGLLHDSYIVETSITTETFLIELDDFTTHVFADAIGEKKKLKIDHDKLVFPIHIEFEINDLTFNTVDDDGNIHEIKPYLLMNIYMNRSFLFAMIL